jgi:hypothetical protein
LKSKFTFHLKEHLSINDIQLIFNNKGDFIKVFEKDHQPQQENKKVLRNIKNMIEAVIYLLKIFRPKTNIT